MARGAASRATIQQRVRLFLRAYAELKQEPYSQRTSRSITFKVGATGTAAVETDVQREEWQSYLFHFRKLTSENDASNIAAILRELPRHVDDAALRARLEKASDDLKAANGITSPLAPLVLGPYASGKALSRLYFSRGAAHSNVEESAVWDRMSPDQRRFVEHEVRGWEDRVRRVVIELKKVIDEATAAGVLRDEPLDLAGVDGAPPDEELPG